MRTLGCSWVWAFVSGTGVTLQAQVLCACEFSAPLNTCRGGWLLHHMGEDVPPHGLRRGCPILRPHPPGVRGPGAPHPRRRVGSSVHGVWKPVVG